MKNVTSRDPRKATIVGAFKQLYGATKVTRLKERADGVFEAHCLKHTADGYVGLGAGTHAVVIDVAGHAHAAEPMEKVNTHFRPSPLSTRTACGMEQAKSATRRARVTCPACKQTDAFCIPLPGEEVRS